MTYNVFGGTLNPTLLLMINRQHIGIAYSTYWLDFMLNFLRFSWSPTPLIIGYSDYLEDKREDYQNCSVLYFVPQLYPIICTFTWTVLKVNLV